MWYSMEKLADDSPLAKNVVGTFFGLGCCYDNNNNNIITLFKSKCQGI